MTNGPPVALDFGGNAAPRILALGAHSDDVEIGCGGTILRLVAAFPAIEVLWVVFSGSGDRRLEAETGAAAFLAGAARSEVVVQDFRDGFFPYQGGLIKEHFEQLKCRFEPDLVFTHYRDDRHQDHRLISELAWNTYRQATILEYEVPKYDGDLGNPNFYVTLDRSIVDAKVEHLLESFPSQRHRDWFDSEMFRAMLRLRGMEARSPSGYAEAFYSRKTVV